MHMSGLLSKDGVRLFIEGAEDVVWLPEEATDSRKDAGYEGNSPLKAGRTAAKLNQRILTDGEYRDAPSESCGAIVQLPSSGRTSPLGVAREFPEPPATSSTNKKISGPNPNHWRRNAYLVAR